MADQKKRISELPESSSTEGLYTLGVNAQNESVKVPLGQILDGIVPEVNRAVTASNQAKSEASEAKTSANEAKTEASEAKTTANQANSNAESANTNATAALEKARKGGTVRFSGFVESATVQMQSTISEIGRIVFIKSRKVFAFQVDLTYYLGWANSESNSNDYNNGGSGIFEDKTYICGDKLYIYDQTTGGLKIAGSEPEVVKTEIRTAVIPRTFINANVLFNKSNAMTLETVCTLFDDYEYNTEEWITLGTVVTFLTADGWKNYRFLSDNPDNGIGDLGNWKEFGSGNAMVGNCYNVTNEQPISGYYDLETAIAATFDKGLTAVGMQITFAIAKASWKTYQFVGSDVAENTFKNISNWLDLAGMSAGEETLINVDALCGACTSASFYTLEYAIAAITDLQKATGINYAKGGLVITYKTGDNQWETKQFNGVASDFGEAALWKDFGGGGGSTVETKDKPEEGGKDAFSTGGAFNAIPTDLQMSYEENVLKAALVNEKGETIGSEKQFVIQSGGGTGGSGTIVSITPEKSPLYAQAGGSIILRAAIRSITITGQQEQSNLIERVELYDRDTNQLLETYRINKDSSADNETFDFEFDLSAYFPLAAQRRFKLTAYDDSDNSGSRNINVTAVDVTIKSEQTLNYTASTAVQVGGAIKTLPMYRFPNNASDKGILCTVEIFIGGEWKTLGTATVSDTYSHSISINPKDCCGTVLTHGAYPIRIHGEDVASGVVGNYLHTTILVVDASNTTPLVALRWYSEKQTAEVKQYETISMDFAVYSAASAAVDAQVIEGGSTVVQEVLAQRSKTYPYTHRVQGVATDGSVTINLAVKAGATTSQTASFRVLGSLLEIEPVTAQLMFDMDMSGRSNNDADKSITDGGYTLAVQGSNYTTNGFVKDTFGKEEYGTEHDTGVMALRIAENVTASLNYQPFNVAAIETNGLALQFRIRTKHVADDEARLISCISNGLGFYVTGKQAVFTFDNAATKEYTITADLKDDSITDIAIVIEPASQAPYGGIGCAKMYFDGELIGTCYYNAGSISRHATPITFDGTHGDLYIYNFRAWETFYSFEQSFNNYLLKMANSEEMIDEYKYNDVMASQAAEGKPATNRPQATALGERGLAYVIITKTAETDGGDIKNYPNYIEGLQGDKKTEVRCDWHIFFPNEPWRNVVIEDSPTTNQGTTSSMRPIKNKRTKTKKCKRIRMMYTLEQLSVMVDMTPERIEEYNRIAAWAAEKKVQIKRGTLPTNVLCIKVDYSDSGGAHNGASTNQYNDLTRALGAEYMTPAQNANTGEFPINPCIESIPIALYRTDNHSSDATAASNAYFHAKGNLNYDKSDAGVFGFEKVQGYNKGCLNYGDFVELIAARNQSLDDFFETLDESTWDKEQVYVLSEFCGNNHKVFRYQADTWKETTGTMTYEGGRWRITGDVVNPVENFEIKVYNAMAWFQGVNSLDDMLAPDSKSKPTWLQYFESRYPDNDELNQAYEDGRKVPYNLYKWLRWCQDCNQNLDSSHGNITIDGVSVSGTKANRLLKFKRELHKEANVKSCGCYHVFTDYENAVDQRSKNMMVGFYLDTDGNIRMYLNHMYDGDCLWGSDNDCGLTIPVELDPNNDTAGYFQGHDSVLFKQLYNADYLWLTDYASDDDINDSTKTTTIAAICKAMREVTANVDGTIKPFSPEGVFKYWITDRLNKYPKLVSSYDGMRKYVENSTPASNYFYALHGLSIQRLQQYVSTRFRFRDSFYGCGDLFTAPLQLRGTGTNMSITIKAAKDGFFALGVDQASSYREGLYLSAGQSHTFKSGNTNLGTGVMLYLFGADRIGELDLRNVTPKQSGWDISQLVLLRKLVLGGANYTPKVDADKLGEVLSSLNLGQLPFLEEVDVRNFPIVNINAEYCPRLVTVRATGSKLQDFTPAQTSPISTLELPATMQTLSFVNLPNLTYPNGGLTIAGFSNVKRLQLSGCANIDDFTLLSNAISGGASIKEIAMPNVEFTADTSILAALMASGAKGIGSDLDYGCDGLTGRWILTELIEDSTLEDYQEYFQGLTVHNAQFTMVMFDDTIDDPANATNLDNNTKGEDYAASGHLLRIRQNLFPVFGKLNPDTGKWEGERISDSDYKKLKDGSAFDYSDTLGTGKDAMMFCKKLWYKGINDFKNQKKYIAWSSVDNEPLSTANNITREALSDIIYKQNSVVITTGVVIGTSTLETSGVLTDTPNYNVYSLDVEGMKQVRYPGLNNANIGAVFLDANGIIIGKFNMAVNNQMFDFVEGDYIFTDVPAGAKTFVFASKNTNGSLEAIAVDSTNIEAIEPDWVQGGNWLGGIYHASVDTLTQLRSLSGTTVRVGTGTSTTSAEWTYDNEGKPTNTPLSAMNYTMKDFQNLAARRGEGYQLFDYEMSKLMAILFYSLTGNRDAQLLCGYGKGSGGTTGYADALGNSDSYRGQLSGNKCLGFESFFGCTYEWMDNILRNVPTYAQALKAKLVDNDTTYTIDHKWHIYDPIAKTERVVDGITDTGKCIARVKHGRFCDVIASKCSSDTSAFAANYADGCYYTQSRCRVVGRSHNNAFAFGGLAYAYTSYASANSHSYYGSRLAFRGIIVISNE